MITSRRVMQLLPTMCGWALATGSVTLAEVIHVPGDFAAIQRAIDAAVDRDEVVVAAGTYHETIDLLGKAITVRSTEGPTTTIIDAQQAGNVVSCHEGEGSDTVLDGFTITGGFSDFGDPPGAGMYNSSSSPTILNCIFRDNFSNVGGGGMFNNFSNPTLIGCVFRDNCACADISFGNNGGGMYNNESSPTLINCVFSGNEGGPASRGGAIYNWDSSNPILINCTLVGNSAVSSGGAIYGGATLINCTVVGNAAVLVGGGISGFATVSNCILRDNYPDQIESSIATVTYSNVQGGFEGDGNIDQNPLFVDALGPDGVYGTDDDNLRLLPGSPCIDAANNDAVPPDTFDLDGDGDTKEPIPFDLDGNPRFVGECGSEGAPSVVDMGVYEAQEHDCNGNDIADSCDLASGTSEDCNVNGIPDECDVAQGSSHDCNSNEIPDECEDCNANGIADECDIAEGTSEDCSNDGVPDECEPDCNDNAIPDSCDIAEGTSEDCGPNGVPDECEPDCNDNAVADDCDIAEGTSDDCNTNGVPDECEADCNDNGVADSCDIAAGTSADCNANAAPDECDVLDGTSQDCDTDGVPDECGLDCNGNALADICDIAGGTSQDCNENTIPDECDIAEATSADMNGDAIPDECQELCLTHDECDDTIVCTIDYCSIFMVCEYLDVLCLCDGDVNGDGVVDPLDSGFVLSRFGCPVGTGDPDCDTADQNGDGLVDPLDVGFILARFGECS